MQISRLIIGVGGALAVVSSSTLLFQWFEKSKLGFAMGIFGFCMPAGSAAAFNSLGYVANYFGWRFSIMITVIVVVISVIGYFDIGVPFLVNFKANINDSYIQDVVEEITEGETTNHGKISSLLRWFNGTDNMVNLWNSVDQGKKIWNLWLRYSRILSKSKNEKIKR